MELKCYVSDRKNGLMVILLLVTLAQIWTSASGACPDNSTMLMPLIESCENENEVGSGMSMPMSPLVCPEPSECLILLEEIDQSTVTVDFSLSCLPTLIMDCVYNYTVEFFPPDSDISLAFDSGMLTEAQVNQTAFDFTSSLLRNEAEVFEMGVVINVTVFRVDGNKTSEQLVIDGAFSPSILNLNVTGRTSTSIALSWSLPFPDVLLPDNYTLQYSYTELSGTMPRSDNKTIELIIGSSTTYEIIGLLPYTLYDVTITAVYNGVPSVDVSENNIQTLEGVSSTVSNLIVEADAETMMFTITWDEPQYPAGVITNYIVIVYQNSNGSNVTVSTNALNASVSFVFYEEYNIIVTPVNGFGMGEAEFIDLERAPEGAPSPPTNFSVQSVEDSSTSLSASWTEPSILNGILTNYSVYCRLSNVQFYPEQEQDDQQFLFHQSTISDNNELVINDLGAFTSYDCYVTASTNGGESEPSNNESTTTNQDTPTVPNDFNNIQITPTTVALEWNRPSMPNGEITEYILEYTNSSLNQPITIVIPVTFNRAANEYNVTSVSIDNLNEFTEYVFNISAMTGGGRGPEATIDVTTNEAAPSAAPVNLSGMNTSSTSILISWEPLPVDDRNGVILGYNVTYESSDNDLVHTSTIDAMINITDLLVYTDYTVSVAAYTSIGNGPIDSIVVTTDSSVPTAPQNVVSRNVTSTSIELTWDPPTTFNGPNEGYEVTYRRIETDETKSFRVTDTSFNITNLEKYEEYSVDIVAYSDKGAGEKITITVLTAEDLPGVVGGFSAVEINATAILVEWQPPSERNGIITAYEVRYSLMNDNMTRIVDSDVLSIELTDLKVFSYYDISVRAYTSVGPGDYSNIIRVQTEPAPASPPSNISTTSSERSIVLTWSTPAMSNGIIQGYYISTNATTPENISVTTLDVNMEVLNVSNTDTLSVTFDGLIPFTSYQFSIAAYSFNLMDTNNGFTIVTGEFSENQVARTLEDLPGPVSNFFADELNLSTILVEWGPPEDRNGIITNYEVEYTHVEDNNTITTNFSSETFSIQLTNLTFHTDYDIRVRAYTRIGSGSYSNSITIRTDPAPATPPVGVVATPNKRSVILIWMEPERPHGIIQGYYISTNATTLSGLTEATLDNNMTVLNVTDIDTRMITFAGLTPFTYYQFSVAAYSYNLMDETSNFSILVGQFSIDQVIRTLEDSPSPPTSFSVQSVEDSSTSLSASWTEPSILNGILTNYSVYCRLSNVQFYPEQEHDDQQFIFHQSTIPDNNDLVINDLEAFTSYDCYVTASTNGGESEPSNDETTRTNQDTPTVPNDFNNIQTTPTTVILEWKRPSMPNGEITEYILEYTDSSLNQPITIVIPVVFNRATNEYNVTSVSIDNLNEFTEYVFNISAMTGGGRGPEATIDVTTNEAAPSATPVNLSGTNTSSTSILISWEPLPVDDRNGVILGYNVTYESNDSDLVHTNTIDAMINITDLLVYTDYTVSVAAYTSIGNGPIDSIVVTTDSTVPTAPQNVVSRNVTSTSIELTWDPPTTFNGPNEGYEVTYRRIETDEMESFRVMDTSVNITNLEIYEEYSVEIVAYSDKGAGEKITISVLTAEDLPGVVGGFSAVEINATAILVEWQHPIERNGIITAYEVRYSLMNDNMTMMVDSDVLSIELTDLKVFSYYDINVRAYTSVGASDYSNIIRVQTEPAPATPPSNTNTTSSERSIVLTWSTPAMSNGIIQGYYISTNATTPEHIDVTTLDVNMEVLNVSNTDTLNVTFDGLIPFTSYQFSIAAYSFNLMDTNNGFTIVTGEFSENQVARTLEDLPGPVSNFFADELNLSTILVEWGPPEDRNGIITNYEVEYTHVEDSNTITANFSSETFSIQLTNLTFHTDYDIRVRAYTRIGSGSYSNSITIRTDPAPATPPVGVVATPNKRSVILIWMEPERPHGIIQGYYISTNATTPSGLAEATLDNDMTVLNVTDIDTRMITFAGLTQFTYYQFSVAAYSYNLMDETSNFSILVGQFSIDQVIRTLEDSPSPPTSFSVQSVEDSSTSLSASWTEPSILNGILTNYSVYCRLSNVQFYPEQEHDDQQFIFHQSTIPDNNDLVINDLEAFTSYDCYVTASTNGGESEPSNDETTRTNQDTPTVPNDFNNIQTTPTTVILEWKRPSMPNGEITEYILEYTDSSLNQPITIVIPVVFNRATNEYNVTSVSIDNLNEFTEYVFNISAMTGGGRGPEATIDVTTNEAAPSATPVNLSGTNTSSTSILISWEPLPVDDRNGVILGYNVTYESNDSDFVHTNTIDTMINITDLLVYTDYTVSVAAYTSIGSGPLDSIVVLTDSERPASPTNLNITVLNSTALSVSWEQPSVVRGARQGYRLLYGLNEESSSVFTETLTSIALGLDDFNFVISGLHEFTGYVVIVQAINDKGLGASAEANVTTAESAPGSGVRNVSVKVLNSTAVLVEWFPPVLRDWNGLITQYTVSYQSTDEFVGNEFNGSVVLRDLRNNRNPFIVQVPLMNESIIISDLQEFITYSFTVTVSTIIGTNIPETTPTEVQITTDESAPSASPVNVDIAILGALSANVTWQPPPYIDRNGIIVNYTVVINDSLGVFSSPVVTSMNYYLAQDLPQFAPFTVSVSASTLQGPGPFSSNATAMTLEGLPSSPRNVSLTSRNQTSISVSWLEPCLPNGIITGYRIFYYGEKANGDFFEGLYKNLTVNVAGNSTRSSVLTELLSDTTYSINVTAFTSTGNGSTGIGGIVYIQPGDPPTLPPNANFSVEVPTDETGSMPAVTENTLRVAFVIPAELSSNGPIKRVRIINRVFGSTNDAITTYYESDRASSPAIPPYFALEVNLQQSRKRGLVKRQANGDTTVSETIGLQLGCGPDNIVCNGPLRPDTEYELKYRAYNSDNDDSFVESTYSAPIKTGSRPPPTNNLSIVIGVVVVIILVIIIVGVVIVVVVFLKSRKKKKLYSFHSNGNSESLLRTDNVSLTKANKMNTGPTIVPLSENVSPAKSTIRGPSTKATPHSRKVYLRDLSGYVTDMVSDSGFKFSEEYEKVSAIGLDHSKDASLMPENRAKNRYTNILAYDHSRVKLDYVDDEPGSDYINANYIPGYKVRRAYIATQGPLPSTFDDFWTMVWEQNVHNIVMLTQLVERGRTKCHRYWPGSQPEVYGDISVEMTSEKELTDWVIRTFELRMEKRSRMVYHFQFVSWPDHGVPDTATAALDFIRCIHENIQTMHGPILVHCSAGVGRTGTFIALGTLLQHIADHDWVDIFGLSCEMRQHRNHMIQTEAQYIFIHKAMIEICECLSTFSGGKKIHGFNPIYVNVGAGTSPGVSQQSEYMFGNSLLSEETSQFSNKAYDESKF